MTAVQERSDPSLPTSEMTTRYYYDPEGRLALVYGRTAGGGQKLRWFDYDGRGFLLHERHPEIDGTINYGGDNAEWGYDSLGNPGSRKIGDGSAFHLGFGSDSLGRQIVVRDLALGGRPLAEFYYANRDPLNSEPFPFSLLRKGRLFQAKRHNYLTLGANEKDVTVTETYDYRDADSANASDAESGRVAGRIVQTSLGPGFETGVGYDDLGQVNHVEYPCGPQRDCNLGIPRLSPRVSSFSYQRGLLARVTTESGYDPAPFQVVPSVSYHRNGGIERPRHGQRCGVAPGGFRQSDSKAELCCYERCKWQRRRSTGRLAVGSDPIRSPWRRDVRGCAPRARTASPMMPLAA